jgi:multiple sugar transport system substrate-binding protein
MKRVILIVMLGLMCVGVFAEQIVIKYAHWNALPEDPYNYVKAFEAKYPQYKVEFTLIPEAEYPFMLRQMAATGTLPDVLCLWEHDIVEFANAGYIIPLDSYVARSEIVNLEDFVPAVKWLMELQHGLYGLPWCFATHFLYYNKDAFDKAGLPYPNEKWTWEDFVSAARALTIVEGGEVKQWGCDAFTFHGIWFDFIGAFGDPIIDKEGRFAIGGCAEQFLEQLYALTKENAVAKPAVAAVGVPVVDLFAAGKAAMAINGSWMTSVYKDITAFAWDIAPLPLVKGKRFVHLHTGFWAINARSPNKDAAWKFIEFCLSEEGQTLISKAYGNPSARYSVMAKGYHEISGPKGPTNWKAALKYSVDSGTWAYLLFPSGLWMDIVNDCYAVMLGQLSPHDAVVRAIEKAKEILGPEKVVPYAPCVD